MRVTDAFDALTGEMTDACIACGACFEACPITPDAGLEGADGEAVTAGILRIIAEGRAADAAHRWANACVLSGDCIAACDHGVNPRLLLSMARMAEKCAAEPEPARRRAGVGAFSRLSKDVRVMSRMQLGEADLARLAPAHRPADAPAPAVIFYTGCNVWKTPHIALLCLDILDLLGIDHAVMGGTAHCCGILQTRAADIEAAGRMGFSTLEKFAATGASEVLAWCPSCFVQFSETTIPTYERTGGQAPVDMTPFMLFLEARLDALRPHLVHRVPMRVALHGHRGVAGVPEAARRLLAATPGVEVVDLGLDDVGLMSNSFKALPDYRRRHQAGELAAAAAAGVDALVAVYHADHRELSAHERDWPFRVLNVLDVVGAGLGLAREDDYKRLKITQDVDAILEDCGARLAAWGIDAETARPILEDAFLGDQPLALRD
ncbi:MAG: (Fe-S)-binding protein [Pseudomonadota bacterium]